MVMMGVVIFVDLSEHFVGLDTLLFGIIFLPTPPLWIDQHPLLRHPRAGRDDDM